MPILVVEKGHCYRNSGSTGTNGEQDYATITANAISALINGNSGWEVRQKLADSGSYSGSAFVAIHCDGSTNPTARGSSVGFQNTEGSVLGHNFMTAYANLGWTGGFRPPNYTEGLAEYYGVRNAINARNYTAIIIECGFLTNPEDKKLLTDPGGPERVAKAVATALGIPIAVNKKGSSDMAYSVTIPPHTNTENEEDYGTVVIGLPPQNGVSKVSSVWVTISNNASPLDMRIAHWQCGSPSNHHLVEAFPPNKLVDAWGTTGGFKAPTDAYSLIIDYRSAFGATAVVEPLN